MTKNLSKIGLILLGFSTLIISTSFYLFSFTLIPFIMFIFIHLIGWILYSISFILIFITKNKYHIVVLRSGFQLKIDHLIIVACSIIIFISFILIASLKWMILGPGEYNLNIFNVLLTISIISVITVIMSMYGEKSINNLKRKEKIQ
ncbi:MAG: hypothetical protein P8Y70_18980 [Candidatus Lokiarchaeota archaeon]